MITSKYIIDCHEPVRPYVQTKRFDAFVRSLVVTPVLFVILIGIAIFVLCIPILTLFYPDIITWNGRK